MTDLAGDWRPLHERLAPDDRVAPRSLELRAPRRRNLSPPRRPEAPDPPPGRPERIRTAQREAKCDWAAGIIELRGYNADGCMEDIGRFVPPRERLLGCTLLLVPDRVSDRTRGRVWTGVEYRVVVPAAREEAQEPSAAVVEPDSTLGAPNSAPEKTGKKKGGRPTRRDVIRSTVKGLTADDRVTLGKHKYKKQRYSWLAEKIARETQNADGLQVDAIRDALKGPPALSL